MRNALLVLAVFAVAMPVTASRTETILQQSDDTREKTLYTGGGRAQWFEAPADCYFLGASFYVCGFGIINVAVWDNETGAGYDYPGTLLGTVSYSAGLPDWEWTDYVDFSELGLIVPENDKFWVGVTTGGALYLELGFDETDPDHGHCVYDSPDWLFDVNRDMMVRVKIDDDVYGPYVDGQTPAPDRTGGADPGTDIVFHCKDDDKGVDSGTIGFSAADGTKVEVSGSLDIDDTDLNDVFCTFTPESDLPEGETITCTVAGTLADGLGNEMGTDTVWSFTVGYVNVDEASVGEIKAGYH
jgi:hypothetical protein